MHHQSGRSVGAGELFLLPPILHEIVYSEAVVQPHLVKLCQLVDGQPSRLDVYNFVPSPFLPRHPPPPTHLQDTFSLFLLRMTSSLLQCSLA